MWCPGPCARSAQETAALPCALPQGSRSSHFEGKHDLEVSSKGQRDRRRRSVVDGLRALGTAQQGPSRDPELDTCTNTEGVVKRNWGFYGLLELDVCLLLRFLIVY